MTATKETNKYVVIIKGKGAYQIDENGNVTIKSGIILDKTDVNLQIIDTIPGEEIITATLEGIEGEISWNSSDTNKVIVTPIDGKSAKIIAVDNTVEDIEVVATCGRESGVCKVQVTTVKSISSISVSPVTVTITNRESFEIEAIVNDGATEIVKWSVDEENVDKVSLSSRIGNKITVTGLKVGEGIELTAKGEFQNKTAKCTITIEPLLSYYGVKVTTGVTSVNGQMLDDNWKIFYADPDDNNELTSEYVYLIYGDYYPANVQTEITSGLNSTIFIPEHIDDNNNPESDSRFPYSVGSRTSGDTLLRYLKNNTTYNRNDYTTDRNYDSVGAAENPEYQYKSWIDLLNAFKNGNALAKKAKKVQGSPTITMLVSSFNEKYNLTDGKVAKIKTLRLTTNAYGYKMLHESLGAWSNDFMPGNEKQKTGGYDPLYNPDYHSNPRDGDVANGYWLSSPGGNDNDDLCAFFTTSSIYVSQWYRGNGGRGLRPVITIEKTDFNNNNLEGIIIE